MRLFGSDDLRRPSIRERVGDMGQICGARSLSFDDGKGEGVRAVEVRTGGGLGFTVLPSRGMDIAWADYRGIPLAFMSKAGLSGPSLYEAAGDEFLRTFHGGLLTTCGLGNTGPASFDQGRTHEMHGRISNIPAHDVCVTNEWVSDEEYRISVSGKVRQSKVYGENLLLSRSIGTRLGARTVELRDRIENEGNRTEEIMLLYHVNLGFPLLDEGAELLASDCETMPRDEVAAAGLARARLMEAPGRDWPETVFFHRLAPRPGKMATAVLFNERLGDHGLGFYLRFDQAALPWLVEWKQMGQGDYVLGMEPATCPPVGRAKARESGGLVAIPAGAAVEYRIEFGIVESRAEAMELLA